MKKRIIIAISSLILLIIVAIIIVAVKSYKNSIQAILYYPNNDCTSLEWEGENIYFDDPIQIPNNIVSALQKKGAFNRNCTINTIDFENSNRITVDFSEEFLTDETQLNILRVYAIVKSICSTSSTIGISEVRVTVNNSPIIASDGKKLGFLSDSSINIMNSDEIMTYECKLYFPNRQGKLRAEKRAIDAANGNIEYNVIDAMLDGPDTKGLTSVFPRGTKLISAETSDGICYVNFDVLPASADIILIKSALLHTLSSLDRIEDVQILSDGKILN